VTRWTDAPIVGGAYSDDTRPWSVQDTVNLIPVYAEKAGTRSPSMLRCAPGYSEFVDLGTKAPIRGMRNVEGLLLVVSGNSLFAIGPKGQTVNVGTIPGVGRVSMSHNQITGGNQVAIANGVGGYVYNTVTGQLEQITDDGFPGSISFDYVDSYITGIEPGRRFAFTSDLADATSYNTLDQYEAEGSPDKLVGQMVTHREWWLFGERTIEPYQNTGEATGTFQRSSGMVMEVGAASTFAISRLDNSVFWLGNDDVVYKANGYTPLRISTHPIEQAISRCTSATAFSFTFEDRGHKIFYLTFQDGQTWGYDVATQEWHRRQSKNLKRWRINDLVSWNGGWYGGDFSNGRIYKLDWDVQTEAGVEMERMRVTGVLANAQNPVMVNAFELVFDTGQPQKEAFVIPLTLAGDLPGGIANTPINPFTYTSRGGTPPVTYSIAAGALPTGLTMDSSGMVSGTPTVAGPFSWTVKGVDSAGNVATLPDSATIADSGFDPNISDLKYLLQAYPITHDYIGTGYDDSAWTSSVMPLGTSNRPDAANYGFPAEIAIGWPLDKACYLRGHFNLTEAKAMKIAIYVDDAAGIFINGNFFKDFITTGNGTPGNPYVYYFEDTIPQSFFVAGSNLIAVICNGSIYGVNNYIDFRLEVA
jgi:hypothetical protein